MTTAQWFSARQLPRHKQNLAIDDANVFSYRSRVASIDHKRREVQYTRKYSATTSRHVSYVARELGYTLKKV